VTHVLQGFALTPIPRIRRESMCKNTSTYRVLRNSVSTVKKSQATIPLACAERNWRQVAVAAWGRIEACAAKDRSDRRFGDPDAQALELAFDPYAPPPRVLPGHAKDQFVDLDIDRWTALPAVGVGPFAPDKFAVPA
jgi:hypothetical protein